MRVRYGYRRIHVLLRPEGWAVNTKRVCRLNREMGLQLRNKTPKRRVKTKLRSNRTTATAANDIWAMDFIHDQLFDGKKIRALTIVNTLSPVSPAVDVRFNYRGSDVVETLERGAAGFKYPKTIRVENGPEFVSKDDQSLGLPERRDARRQSTRQADGQGLHRIVQRKVQSGVSEREPVHEPRRGACKMRGLA